MVGCGFPKWNTYFFKISLHLLNMYYNLFFVVIFQI